ncbi:MAG: 4-hydroxy-3-methylbut-2-enyl diphosphate reductase [Armatimonadota bacterium]|nr:MAG: 4-hydroxy-3-methylbut-2-enyl diphosphate reductase [Armatimonadota bacterium]
MEIIVAENAGFCFGVERALQMVKERGEQTDAPIVTLGPLIHNPQVVERLREQGVSQVSSVRAATEGALVIPSHGISPEVAREARERGLHLLDATCPFVARAQDNARALAADGYQVVILGDKGHPEVAGLVGAAGGQAVVVQDEAELDVVRLRARVGMVVQTTQTSARLRAVAGALAERCRELRAFNTICAATSQRQESALSLAQRVDAMVVVGGKISANTNRLHQLCEQTGVPTYHVETAAELNPDWFEGKGKVGVTAGASTPDWVIQDVVEALRAMGD